MPRYQVEEVERRAEDFSGGLVSRISPVGLRGQPKVLKANRNVIFRPRRAVSVRPGSRDSSAATLTEKPTSLGKYYSSGGNRLFVATDDGASGGKVFRHSISADTQQTLPFTPTDRWWNFEMANGVLVACQAGGAQPPCFFDATNPTNTYLTCVLPKPASAITFNADSAGGSLVTGKTYYFRLRYRYNNGSSKAGPVSAGRPVTTPNLTVNLIIPVPGSPRADYLGWTLEATAQNGSATGPFYFVTDGTAATYTYAGPDSSLGYEADETLHGEPVAMDGTIYHRGRLFGWRNSNLYMSQPTGATAEEATGIFNWVGDAIYPVAKDDGDTIQTVLIQEDRLVILKQRSVHTLDGIDIDSFVLSQRYEGAGAAGPRAACTLGATVAFAAGDGRMFQMRGNAVVPMGADEIGDYLDAMDFSRDDEIVALNYLGDYLMFWYVASDKDVPDDVLVYDLRFGVWSHFDGWPAVDALVQKDRVDFNSATLLMADPSLLPPSNSAAVALNPSFVTWQDYRSAANPQIFAQRVNSDGSVSWTVDGTQISNSSGNTLMRSFSANDGSGGVIILWHDQRNGFLYDVYGQRLNAAGAAQWTAGGLALEVAATNAVSPQLLAVESDRNGGAIYVYLNPSQLPVVQRINAAGAKQWGGGTTVDTSAHIVGFTNASSVRIVPNADGSCFVVWSAVDVSGNFENLKAQLFNSSGVAQWASTTVGLVVRDHVQTVVTGTSDPNQPAWPACPDGSGGLIIGYTFTPAPNASVYVQRLNSAGTKLWGTNGVLVNSVAGASSPAIVRDGHGGCLVAWRELSGLNFTVRARPVSAAGIALGTPRAISSTSTVQSQFVQMVEDGAGGAIVAWSLGPVTAVFVLAQRINSSAQPMWAGPTVVASTGINEYTSFDLFQMSTDASSGAVFTWSDDRSGVGTAGKRDIYAQRIDLLGAEKWTSGGVLICANATQQDVRDIVFTDTPETEYPPSLTPGYHVWCGFTGTVDRAASDGSGGDDIPMEVQTHMHDDGVPRYTKDWERIEVYVNKGTADLSVKVTTDIGATAALAMSAQSNLDTWNDGSVWDDGSVWGTDGRKSIVSGLPKGTEGRKSSVTISASQRDPVELGGFLLTGYVLPEEVMS